MVAAESIQKSIETSCLPIYMNIIWSNFIMQQDDDWKYTAKEETERKKCGTGLENKNAIDIISVSCWFV